MTVYVVAYRKNGINDVRVFQAFEDAVEFEAVVDGELFSRSPLPEGVKL